MPPALATPPPRRRRRRYLVALTLAWALATLYLVAMRTPSMKGATFMLIPHYDKIIHTIIFGGQAYLLARLWKNWRHGLLLALSVASAFGAFTELLQLWVFTYRSADALDWLADTVGACLGVALWRLEYAKWQAKAFVRA